MYLKRYVLVVIIGYLTQSVYGQAPQKSSSSNASLVQHTFKNHQENLALKRKKKEKSTTHIRYKGMAEIGYQIGLGHYGADRLSLNLINGIQFNPYFSIGIGTGTQYYYNEKQALIPFFGDIRIRFTKKRISPYLVFDFGYSFNASKSFNGEGIIMRQNAGVSYNLSNKLKLNFGVGYERQKQSFYKATNTNKATSYALTINLGIVF